MSAEKPDALLFLDHLEQLFGETGGVVEVKSSDPNLPPVRCFLFFDTPEEGLFTAVTYGLSAASHPDWVHGKPELMLCLETGDENWADAMAWFAEAFRGEKAFGYGHVFSTDGPLASDSTMSGFVVFAPPLLEGDEKTVQLSDFQVHLAGFYPLYAGELELIRQHGLEKFWKNDAYDPMDVKRPDFSAAV